MGLREQYKFGDKLRNVGDIVRISADAKKVRSALSQWAKKNGKKVVTRMVESDSIFGDREIEIELVDNTGLG